MIFTVTGKDTCLATGADAGGLEIVGHECIIILKLFRWWKQGILRYQALPQAWPSQYVQEAQ